MLVYKNRSGEQGMSKNVGTIDRVIRLIIGVALIAFAVHIGFPETGWNWLGWIGVVPILTALFGMCPLYRLIGVSTCATNLRSA
jgi:membrane-associated protease RseP (regulator of RpoE activity)